MFFSPIVSRARTLCRARGPGAGAGGAIRKRPHGRRASFERLESREVLSSSIPIPGVVLTSVGAATSDRAWAGFLDSTGDIVVAGDSSGQTKAQAYRNFAVLRYTANGVLDTGFGTSGVVTTTFQTQTKPAYPAPSTAFAAAAYAGGRIVAAGSVAASASSPEDFALARYTSNGSVDSTFNYQAGSKKGSATYGTVQTNLGGSDRIRAVVVQSDNEIVAAGNSNATGTTHFTLARYTTAGKLDGTFGAGGVVTTSFGGAFDYLEAATLQQGKILAAGEVCYPDSSSDFALARYNADGSLDPGFGTAGKVITNYGWADNIRGAAVYPSTSAYPQYIVVTGESYGPTALDSLVVARYAPDGTLDPTFGTGGIVDTAAANAYIDGKAVAIQTDGKIVVAGYTQVGYAQGIVVARYDTLGKLDPTFGSGGMATTWIPNVSSVSPKTVMIQPGGNIVVTGSVYNSGRPVIMLARYDSSGNLDSTFGASGAAGASAASATALTDAALADAGRQQLALAALLQYEDQLQSKPAARNKGLELPAIDLALLDLAS